LTSSVIFDILYDENNGRGGNLNKRYEELDSLRGLAALTVLFSHFLLVFPFIENDTINNGYKYLTNIFKYSPLHIFFAGHEAVIFFFILSGFVLSLTLFRFEKNKFGVYAFKRFLRIYPPYITAVLVAIITKYSIPDGDLTNLSEWIQTRWDSPTTLMLTVQHVLLLGEFRANDINPVLWSMVHEMRISLIFPFVVYFLSKWSFFKTAISSLVLSFIGIVLMKLFHVEGSSTNYFITLHYLSFFMAGGLLAKYRAQIIFWFKKRTIYFKWFLWLVGWICYTYKWIFPSVDIMHNIMFDEWAAALGASIFIVISLSSSEVSKILKIKPIVFLGKISYSLYLYHAIVLVVCVNLLYPTFGIGWILLISFILSLLVSSIGYYAVEKPSMQLSRTISKRQKVTKPESLSVIQ
jgi:peptidoglycan/LPS O-acetylase OafA/YrhL